MDKIKLQKIADDNKMPIFIQTMAKGLIDGKRGMAALEIMLDRAHGKPKQKLEDDRPPLANITLTLKVNDRHNVKLGDLPHIPAQLSEPEENKHK